MKLKILLYYIFFIGCSNPTAIEEQQLRYVSFDLKLPQDDNGYYHLILDRSKNQTLHNIYGGIEPAIAYKRFEWESNLSFYSGPYLANTTNIRSYTDKDGEFINTIGPILEMAGDTMELTVRWDPIAELDDMYFYQPTKIEIFYIVLK